MIDTCDSNAVKTSTTSSQHTVRQTLSIELQRHVEQNKTEAVVEDVRQLTELLIWGDKHDPAFFDYFLERNILGQVTYEHPMLWTTVMVVVCVNHSVMMWWHCPPLTFATTTHCESSLTDAFPFVRS